MFAVTGEGLTANAITTMVMKMFSFDGNCEHGDDLFNGTLFLRLLLGFEMLCKEMHDEGGDRVVVGGGFIRRFPFTSLIFV